MQASPAQLVAVLADARTCFADALELPKFIRTLKNNAKAAAKQVGEGREARSDSSHEHG